MKQILGDSHGGFLAFGVAAFLKRSILAHWAYLGKHHEADFLDHAIERANGPFC